jgi:alanyl-tRNA synthetase
MRQKLDAHILCENHDRRLKRGGSALWTWLMEINEESQVTASEALKIMDVYGLRASDMLLLLELKGCRIDIEEFCDFYNKQEDPMMLQCQENQA